jgi:hypothetical protein
LTTYKKELPKIGKISVVVRRCFQLPGADPVALLPGKIKTPTGVGACVGLFNSLRRCEYD